ncbi:MAG TPA: efflux RND transporter periplasmic adaptor subunit [Candidatus Limnocylindrales bacterium]|nr:efflux RND transporter periplasmic adaptor subunit [Candidatus Limnocylindrales bacterium]
MSIGKRYAILAGLAIVLAGGGLAAYFSSDSRAREKPAAKKGPATVPVSVVAADQRSIPVRLQAIGNVEAYTSVAVKSRVDGQILEVQFREGQEVKKGQVLFRIDARAFEAALKQSEAQAARDVASRDQAASQERRYQELLDKNFVSKDAYAQFRTNAQTAEATSKASQAALENARLNLDYTVIRSPIDGFVGRALLQAGNMVKANDTVSLVVINQVKPVYVSFAIPEQQLSTVRDLMQKGPLTVEVAAPGDQKTVATGRIAFLDNAVDQTTGTIKVRAVFDNSDAKLWPGQYYTVQVKLYDQENAIVVPSRALQTGPDGQFVYVVKPDMTAELRKVEVARTDGDHSVLAGGKVAKGERVVVRGALRIAPGIKVNIVDAGAAS